MSSAQNQSADHSEPRRRSKKRKRIKPSNFARIQNVLYFPFKLALAQLRSAWFPAVLLLSYFFVYASSFVILLNPLVTKDYLLFSSTGGGLISSSAIEEAAEAFKSSLGLVFYASSVLLVLAHFREMLRFARKNYHVIIMLILPIIGMYVSVIPEKVLYSVIQLFAGLFIALSYAITRRDKSLSFVNLCILLLLPMAAIHIYSHILFFIHITDYTPFIEGAARYGGLSGNPNSLGASATIGFWLALYIIMDKNPTKLSKLFAVLCLLLFLLSIVVSGSGTSKATVAALFSVLIVLRLYIITKGNSAPLIYVYSLALLLIVGSGWYFINNSISDLGVSVIGGLGKETNLTGRTQIWDIGLSALMDRPFLGWGLDNHETVLGYETYKIPFGITHYHNGYIDTAVSSGIFVLMFVLYNILKYIRYFFHNFRINRWSFGMAGPLIILIMNNFSEYSLMRPLNTVYQLYICAFCLLAVAAYYQDGSNESSRQSVSVKKKKSRKRHYRFG